MKKKKRKASLVPVVIITLLLVAVAVWFVFKPDNVRQSAGSQNTIKPASNASPTEQPTTVSDTNAKQPDSNKPSGELLAPTGSFVSNHHPNLDGSPAPNQEQSVCNTTPGASCNIEFTSGGVTKSLGSKVTGSDGAAIWTWTLQSVGLTQGSWQIKAIATQGEKVKTTEDSLSIDVGP